MDWNVGHPGCLFFYLQQGGWRVVWEHHLPLLHKTLWQWRWHLPWRQIWRSSHCKHFTLLLSCWLIILSFSFTQWWMEIAKVKVTDNSRTPTSIWLSLTCPKPCCLHPDRVSFMWAFGSCLVEELHRPVAPAWVQRWGFGLMQGETEYAFSFGNRFLVQVDEVSLKSCVFHRWDGCVVIYPTHEMAHHPFINVSRSSNRWESFLVSFPLKLHLKLTRRPWLLLSIIFKYVMLCFGRVGHIRILLQVIILTTTNQHKRASIQVLIC